jgi:hypothetical protein
MEKRNSKNSRKKKKIKSLKDSKKIKVILSDKKEIKEIKEDKKESKSIEESEEFSNLEFSESPSSSPVLEKVAVQRNFGELEQEVGFVPTATGEREEDKDDLKYNEIGSDQGYAATSKDNQGNNYTTSEAKGAGFHEEDEDVETRRRMAGGDFNQNNLNKNGAERMAEFQDDADTRETKQYMSSGDYK